MDWAKVARHLYQDAELIRQRSETAFAGDIQTQQEMRTRACLLESIGLALWNGLDAEGRGGKHFINDKAV